MRAIGFILLFGIILFARGATAGQTLPYDLKDYMNSLSTTYIPINQADLLEQLLIYEKITTQIINDFDGDGRTDYALLVNNFHTYVSVVVFLKRDQGYSHYVLDEKDYHHNFDVHNVEAVMIPVAQGEIKGVEKSYTLNQPGIYVSWYLSPTSSVYYWDEDKFVRFATSD
jgi:hypothetical protein